MLRFSSFPRADPFLYFFFPILFYLFFPLLFSPPSHVPCLSCRAELLKQPFRLFGTMGKSHCSASFFFSFFLFFGFFPSAFIPLTPPHFPFTPCCVPIPHSHCPPSPIPTGTVIPAVTSGSRGRGRQEGVEVGCVTELLQEYGWICLPMCSPASTRARGSALPSSPGVCVFALMGRGRIWFVPLFQALLQSIYRWLFFFLIFFGNREQ